MQFLCEIQTINLKYPAAILILYTHTYNLCQKKIENMRKKIPAKTNPANIHFNCFLNANKFALTFIRLLNHCASMNESPLTSTFKHKLIGTIKF